VFWKRRNLRWPDARYVGPFVFGFEDAQEGLQSQFWFNTSCTSYRRRWTMEQGKVTKIGCEKDSATPTRKK
jgi:hypothetical protein